MAQTIRRGGKGVRRAAATRGAKARVATARKQTGTLVGNAVRWMPLSDEMLHRILIAGIIGGVIGLAAIGVVSAGLPAMAEQQLAALADHAGFKVKRVEVRGVNRMNEMAIYERVLGQRDQAMSRVDPAGLRAGLLQLSWVKDARVSRQLPDTLVIDVVERNPHAVLHEDGRYVLIDETGHELETVPQARAKGLLAVAGNGVKQQIAALDRLLETAPALKAQVAQAEWIGNRRWNLTFRTGQVLALPEGDDEGAAALLSFARMDGIDRLIGGKVSAFDMRVPDKVYLRVPGHADEVSAEAKAAAVARAARAAGADDVDRSTGPASGHHAANHADMPPRAGATAHD